MNEVLERFLREATHDDYPASTVRAPSRRVSGWHLGGPLVWVATALLGVIVVSAAVTFRSSAATRTSTHEALVERVRELSVEVQDLQGTVSDRNQTVEALRFDLLDADGGAQRLHEMEGLSIAGGTSRLSGPGVVVTIDDAPDADRASLNRVLDRDLQDIVNSLWRMGAEGVAVNNQRLTQTSAIRGAGEAILVNYQPLTRPYVVSAVGTSSSGPGGNDLERLLDVLSRDYGLVSTVDIGDVALPAGETHESRFAQTVPLIPSDPTSKDDEGAAQP